MDCSDEAVKVANIFTEQDELIVETRGRVSSSRRKHFARQRPINTEIPLVVLVNGKSASASEIVAGAIQDLDRGIIIGSRSFGKGLVQNIRPLSYNTQLKVTIAKYYTPSGRCIQAINYAEKNPDGSIARIPDSLKNSFSTANGRRVFDGGGIEPDISIEHNSRLTLVSELDRQGIIFDFVTAFVAEHPEIEAPRAFTVTEDLYASFVNFAREQGFSYQTEAEQQLTSLEETLQEEAYAEELEEELQNLRQELATQKDMDLNLHQDEIIPLLKNEILRRYYFERGALEGALTSDPHISTAVRYLSERPLYQSVLAP